jgi:hypothetical protein
MTAARWMTDKAALIQKLRPPLHWRTLPRLGEGDAGAVAATAGLAEDDLIDALADAVEDALGDLESARDAEDREAARDAREALTDAVEEFLGEVRRRLLPEVAAAEDAEAEALRQLPLRGLE